MRFSEETRYPHPVLGLGSGDFTTGGFEVNFQVIEDATTGGLKLEHEITLTEAGIIELVKSGSACVGCFISCLDTFYTDLRMMPWPKGCLDFAPGKLLSRVSIRPIIWMVKSVASWNPGTIHPEFSPPVEINCGDIIAIGDEYIISVGQAKLLAIESIFELVCSPEVDIGKLQVDLTRDKITILASEETHKTILLLREQTDGKPVVLNGIYLPVIMEVLDALRGNLSQYETQRWYSPFMARCDSKGVDPDSSDSILENAEKLLDAPIGSLSRLVNEVV
jgi:hypothetical protein